MNPYIGHDSQIWSVEEHRLVGGKGDGMRLLEISSGTGVHLTVSLDRAADISRLRFRGSIWGTFPRAGMWDRHIMTGERIIFSNPLQQDF